MHYAVLGGPADGPTLRLDWQRFAYAGKFVMSNTGKAVAFEGAPLAEREDWPPRAKEAEAKDVVAAVSFNDDRTDPDTSWLRYVTVRDDRRGDGVGARLCAFTAEWLLESADRVQIAVNNPFAYEALHKAGFGYTGEETGIAELVLARPCDSRADAYQAGLDRYRERDLSAEEEAFLDRNADSEPPDVVEVPAGRTDG